MSLFKEQIKKDISNVFMESIVRDEFTTKHIVDGIEMNVILDNNEHIEREKRLNKFDDALWVKQILFYVSKEEFKRGLPMIGRTMSFDNKIYIVTDAIDEDGIYSISLEAKRG